MRPSTTQMSGTPGQPSGVGNSTDGGEAQFNRPHRVKSYVESCEHGPAQGGAEKRKGLGGGEHVHRCRRARHVVLDQLEGSATGSDLDQRGRRWGGQRLEFGGEATQCLSVVTCDTGQQGGGWFGAIALWSACFDPGGALSGQAFQGAVGVGPGQAGGTRDRVPGAGTISQEDFVNDALGGREPEGRQVDWHCVVCQATPKYATSVPWSLTAQL